MHRFQAHRVLLLPLLFTSALFAQQPVADASATPCILQNGAQHCSETGLREAVATARAIAVESGPRDRVGEGQLRSFVEKLGKSLALSSDSADLVLKLSPVEQTGVNFGAADRELALLNVYAPVGPARRQQLIWVETVSGPADLSWPASVARLLEQFRHRVKEH